MRGVTDAVRSRPVSTRWRWAVASAGLLAVVGGIAVLAERPVEGATVDASPPPGLQTLPSVAVVGRSVAIAEGPSAVQARTPAPALPSVTVPYGAAAGRPPEHTAAPDASAISVTRLSGAALEADLGRVLDRLPSEIAERIRRDGATQFVPTPKEPLIPFERLPPPRTDCSVLARLSGAAVLRISESGRILGARMLAGADAPVPSELYACEFGSIPNDGSASVFQTVTTPSMPAPAPTGTP